MKVLVFGANGQVGKDLVLKLNQNNIDFKAYERESLDITDREQLLSVFKKERPSFVVNAAAYTAVDLAEEEELKARAVNTDAPGIIAKLCSEFDTCLVHISTDYVFDGESIDRLYSEEDVTNPETVYGTTKRDGEIEICEVLAKYIILRTSWVFGEHGNNFVKTMLRLSKSNDELRIVHDQVGAPTYAGDISKAIIQILKADNINYGIFHFCGAPYVSWYEFANEIFKKAKAENIIEQEPILKPIQSIDFPQKAKRPKNSRLATAKIELKYNIQPSNWLNALDNIKDYK